MEWGWWLVVVSSKREFGMNRGMGMESSERYSQLVARARQSMERDNVMMVREEPSLLQERTPVSELADFIIQEAVGARASDVHFEPQEDLVRIRMRVNGHMQTIFQAMPLDIYGNLISRFKIICGLDIAESRLPQDGRFAFSAGSGNSSLDIRLSVVPTITGEKIVLRLLNNKDSFKSLSQLDLSPANLRALEDICSRGNGAVLMAGPVNSGKTTTLYAILSMLNQEGNNIISIEDPVEYRLEGLNQIQINEKIGFTFEEALHAVLRQDFDCLAVGEIRSSQVADMVISSALTGRRVYATIHTPGAVKTVHRLLDMGIRPYLLKAAIGGIVGQRLLRRLCPMCREKYTVARASREAEFLGDGYKEGLEYYRVSKEGCPVCEYKGYIGRIAIQEVMLVPETDMPDESISNTSARDVCQESFVDGTMREDGIRKAKDGLIELEELMRIF